MIGLILSLLGGGGIFGALLYFIGPSKILGFLGKIPWEAYAIAALAGLIAFLIISRGHALERARKDEADLAQICAAMRQASGRPHQDCRLAPKQIQAFGASIAALEKGIADQNAKIQELGRKSAAGQAEAAKAERKAKKLADQAEGIAEKLDQGSKHPPANPCSVSKELESQWQ